jgi:hypothetical protein
VELMLSSFEIGDGGREEFIWYFLRYRKQKQKQKRDISAVHNARYQLVYTNPVVLQ